MRIVIVAACALACGACTQETVKFKASPQQQAIVRDGRPALISKRKNSLVMIRPATRQVPADGRPVFVVGVHNLTAKPVDFLVRNVAVTQAVGTGSVPIKVFTYEDLVAEEKSRQVIAALLVGAAAGINAAAASNAGHGYSSRTVRSARGTRTTHTATYSSSRARAAQSRALRENEKLIDAAIAQGQDNLAVLERDVLKDNTLMPGEWYGGTLHLQPPARSDSESAPKTYSIAMMIGPDHHEISVVQDGAR